MVRVLGAASLAHVPIAVLDRNADHGGRALIDHGRADTRVECHRVTRGDHDRSGCLQLQSLRNVGVGVQLNIDPRDPRLGGPEQHRLGAVGAVGGIAQARDRLVQMLALVGEQGRTRIGVTHLETVELHRQRRGVGDEDVIGQMHLVIRALDRHRRREHRGGQRCELRVRVEIDAVRRWRRAR
jgi:hypothetical protein